MGKFDIMDIIMWLIVAAVIVLIITHAGEFATAVSAVGNTSNATLSGISGGGFNQVKTG